VAMKVLTGVVLVVAVLLVVLVLVVPGLSWADVLHFMTTSNLPCACAGQ
jgi:preprotein translocase subunit SecG